MELTVPINKIIHEAFEIAVQTQLRCLVKDIAGTLGKEPAPLLKSLGASKTISYYSYSESADDNIDLSSHRCTHFIEVGKSYITRCNEPIVWGSNRPSCCLQHLLKPNKVDAKLPILHLYDDMYIDRVNGYVTNLKGDPIGRYMKGKIILFQSDST
jgi:hypothetical protein